MRLSFHQVQPPRSFGDRCGVSHSEVARMAFVLEQKSRNGCRVKRALGFLPPKQGSGGNSAAY